MGMLSNRPVTAIIVTYQSERTLEPMLAAARRCHDEQLLDCIIVDNGSSDLTQELLLRESNWAKIMLTRVNNGFGRGCNLGLAEVRSPYTIFINPDAVVEPDAVRGLLAFMELNPQVGIAGPAIMEGELGQPYVLQGAGARATPMTMVRAALPMSKAMPMRTIVPGGESFRTGWVCGAVFMVRTELILQLGGFDPRFFLYWEEVDVCQRADDLGFQTWAVASAVARHVGGASSIDDGTRVGGCIAKYYYQSRRYYMIKHHGWLATTAAELCELVLLGLRAATDAVRGRGWTRLRVRLQAALLSQPPKV